MESQEWRPVKSIGCLVERSKKQRTPSVFRERDRDRETDKERQRPRERDRETEIYPPAHPSIVAQGRDVLAGLVRMKPKTATVAEKSWSCFRKVPFGPDGNMILSPSHSPHCFFKSC